MWLTFPRDSLMEKSRQEPRAVSHTASLLASSQGPHLGNGAAHSGLSPPTSMNDQEDP